MKVLTAFNRVIRDCEHLTDQHSAVIEAARVLARRLDRDLPGDNVSASVFLKYLEALGLTPDLQAEQPASGASKLGALQADMQRRFKVVNGG